MYRHLRCSSIFNRPSNGRTPRQCRSLAREPLGLQHQVKQMKKGQQADNLIDPASLSSFERRHLKEAFAIIRKTQGTLAYLYRTDVTS